MKERNLSNKTKCEDYCKHFLSGKRLMLYSQMSYKKHRRSKVTKRSLPFFKNYLCSTYILLCTYFEHC